MTTIHLIGNAHIDPVWLWDWREGFSEGLSTCQAMVSLLEENPDMTFIRGESAIYEYIKEHDPETFAAIQGLIKEGRWDVVGGGYIQQDNNLPATEPLLRQFVRGKKWFRNEFGVDVTAAWSADAFGHSAGLPEILAAAGFQSLAITRPQDPIRPIAKPAFWWEGAGGSRILVWRSRHGWYGTERDEVKDRLNAALSEAEGAGLKNGACFYGLGDHGGGPSRRQLQDIMEWAEKHPEVRVIHSGLHRLFSDLRNEIQQKGQAFLPTVRGELNFCLRGGSASVARFKYFYRKTQSQLLRAERTAGILGAALEVGQSKPPFAEAWDTLLFSAFHDILPGSSIERAYDDQFARLGGAFYAAQRAENDALLLLAKAINTQADGWQVPEDHPMPVPLLVWNPHPFPVTTHIELEVGLDYRPIWNLRNRHEDVPILLTGPDGKRIRHQLIPEESDCIKDLPWRKRVVIPITVQPLGWNLVHMGMPSGKSRASAKTEKPEVTAISSHTITNKLLSLTAKPGATAVKFTHRGRPWLGQGLQFRLYEDPWGSWGGMTEEVDSWLLTQEREQWTIEQTQLLESGPERAALWVRFGGKNSRIDLTFQLSRGANQVSVKARVFVDDRSARLKLIVPAGGPAKFEVPGGSTERAPCGEVPGGCWVCAGIQQKASARLGFASNALYGFDTTTEEFRATIVRSSRFGGDVARGASETPWIPTMDAGEHRFEFLMTPDFDALQQRAALLEEPLVTLPVPAHPGKMPASGQFLQNLLPQFRVLSLRQLGKGILELRLQNDGSKLAASFTLFNQRILLGRIGQNKISTWHLIQNSKTTRWKAIPQKCAVGD